MVTHTEIEKPRPRVRVPQGKNSPAVFHVPLD